VVPAHHRKRTIVQSGCTGVFIVRKNVLGREAILIHPADNAMKQLLGCNAPVTELTGEGTGTESGSALGKLKALVYSLWDMEVKCFF